MMSAFTGGNGGTARKYDRGNLSLEVLWENALFIEFDRKRNESELQVAKAIRTFAPRRLQNKNNRSGMNSPGLLRPEIIVPLSPKQNSVIFSV